MDAEKTENRSLMFGLIAIVVVTLLLAIIGFVFMREPDEIIEGQADATSVRISGKLPGRVVELMVSEGDMVKSGDTLVHIHSSLAEAKLMQAEAMENVAAAQNQKVDAGTRSQIIQAAAELVAQAKAGATITRKTYDRMQRLFEQGVVSEQKRDEAKAAYDAAVAAQQAAESQLSLARSGAQKEDKESAAALVTAARGGVAEVESMLEDQYLTAPCDGQIDQIYPQPGELVSLGAPIMSLLKIDDKWVTFNVREELLSQMKLGDSITVEIPALDRMSAKARIYYVRDMAATPHGEPPKPPATGTAAPSRSKPAPQTRYPTCARA